MSALAALSFMTPTLGWAVAGVVVFIVFVIVARVVTSRAVAAMRSRQMHSDNAVLAGRALTFLLIGLGAIMAVAIGIESQNVALAGIVLATIIASFGVQDLLKDYVSGYYVLLERHIKVGDRISVDSFSGVVKQIKLRVTLLSGDSGDEVVVPNSVLFNRPVVVAGHGAHAKESARSAPPG